MKRYVAEFANDCLRSIRSNDLMQPCYKFEKYNRISNILNSYNNGFISPVEAVKAIANTMEA